MNKPTATLDSYAEQIVGLTRALTSLHEEAARALPVDRYSQEQILLFAEENVEKRRELLDLKLSFLAGIVENLDKLLADYIADSTAPAYDTTNNDVERFLQWLEQHASPTPEQIDNIACEGARLAVHALGCRLRREHLRFQELRSVSQQLGRDLAEGADLTVHLNPLRVWSRFYTRALLDQANTLPADVLFFAVGPDVHTAVLDRFGRTLVRELAALEPCSFETWVACSQQGDRDKLRQLCLDLTGMGLVAFS
jgi:hypothetical protein